MGSEKMSGRGSLCPSCFIKKRRDELKINSRVPAVQFEVVVVETLESQQCDQQHLVHSHMA
jgi:hypothetical protein